MAGVAETVEVKQSETAEKTKAIIFDELRRDFAEWLEADEDLIWRPPIELTEKDNEFTVRAIVAGVDPKDVEVLVAPEIMLIKAEPGLQDSPKRGTLHRSEFVRGKLSRSIQFPKAINPDKVRAEIKDGLLSIKAEIADANKAETLMALAA